MKKQQDFTKTSGFWIAIALIVIAFLYYDPIMAFLSGTPSLSISSPNDIPTYTGQCTDYDLNLEFTRVFGVTNMMALRDSCERGGGVWTSGSNQVSCHWPSTISVNCAQPALSYVEDLCENLHANYVCSNVSKFVGCLCNIAPPNLPLDGIPPDSDTDSDSEEYTCGWHDSIVLIPQCGGTCPAGTTCTIKEQECGCFSESSYVPAQIGSVFVSKNQWSGAMGGLAGVDDKCQVSAQFAGFPGTWKGIISSSSVSAQSRLPDTAYYLLNGAKLADNKADLFDGSVLTAVNVDEYGNKVVSSHVWTGTDTAGSALGDLYLTCHDWAWVSEGYFGKFGDVEYANAGWISNTVVDVCSDANRIYCARVG